jgi:hypothetical protein
MAQGVDQAGFTGLKSRRSTEKSAPRPLSAVDHLATICPHIMGFQGQ